MRGSSLLVCIGNRDCDQRALFRGDDGAVSKRLSSGRHVLGVINAGETEFRDDPVGYGREASRPR
jgi:hypothetical protein